MKEHTTNARCKRCGAMLTWWRLTREYFCSRCEEPRCFD
jgi:hypothetical protein